MADVPINQIICGAAEEVLPTLPAESINCCISSPPYWALRDYGVEGQLGLEPTFEEYIDRLCNIYDEVKGVLRKDGTCFVNLGDTYWGGGRNRGSDPENMSAKQKSNRGTADFDAAMSFVWKGDYPAKSLCLIPERFAIEMVNRGWILRNTIIWHKPNPMPSSAKDRFTVDFEYVFFFTKSNKATQWIHPRKLKMSATRPRPDYIWIHEVTGLELNYQPFSDRICKGKRRLWKRRNLWEGEDYFFEPIYEPYLTESNAERPRMGQGDRTKYKQKRCGWLKSGRGNSEQTSMQNDGPQQPNPLGRNKRTVWTIPNEGGLYIEDEVIAEQFDKWLKVNYPQQYALWKIPTEAFAEAHFATFPRALVEPMILAGCPEFVCEKCGLGRRKVYEKGGLVPDGPQYKPRGANKPGVGVKTAMTPAGCSQGHPNFHYEQVFKGLTDCGCRAGWRPGVCLDPFRRGINYLCRSRAA